MFFVFFLLCWFIFVRKICVEASKKLVRKSWK